MSVSPVPMTATQSSSPAPASAPNPAGGSDELTSNDFMTLLVAQLKNQDPTNPMDPTQFVQQLVQFNSLEQLIGINQGVGTLDSTVSAAGSTTGTSSGSTTQAQNS